MYKHLDRRDALKHLLLSSLAVATRGIAAQAIATKSAAIPSPAPMPSGPLAPRAAAFTPLRMGEVLPAGWVRVQMQRDLREGFAGVLDKLCSEASSDIFCTGRNSGKKQNKGNASNVNWWNGETEGNWRAGHIGLAFLSGDADAMHAADVYVAHILSFQDADGYLGVFAPDVRFTKPGDLWTQACLFRGLLDYAEMKSVSDPKEAKHVHDAVVRAVDLTMQSLTRERMQSLALAGKASAGGTGISHDLMFADVAERLYAETADARYVRFIAELYHELGAGQPGADTALSALLDPARGFNDHGVNTYETIRVPLWLAQSTGRTEYATAGKNALLKLARYTEPSGSAVSEESVFNLPPEPATTLYEYCSTKEIQCTLQSALQKSGDARVGDAVEHVWFNAAQGSRLPDGKAISYLSCDNQLHLERGGPGDTARERAKFRHKYSPTHTDVAVCCNPNATIVAPLYVRDMWMRTPDGGLAAALYGPCTVATSVHGVDVKLEEKTNYPFEPTADVTVHPAKPVACTLRFRVPGWSTHTQVTCAGARVTHTDGWVLLQKTWREGDIVRVRFTPQVRTAAAVNGEVALLYGPLLFAQPIAAVKKIEHTYPLPGFEDTTYQPLGNAAREVTLVAGTDAAFGFVPGVGAAVADPLRPFDAPLLTLRGNTVSAGGKSEPVQLVPLGNAPTLRRVTFPANAVALAAKNGQSQSDLDAA
jgi:DUF1680 family protein